MARWSKRKVKEFYEIVRNGNVTSIEDWLAQNGLNALPKRTKHWYEADLNLYYLLEASAYLHDADVLRMLVRLGAEFGNAEFLRYVAFCTPDTDSFDIVFMRVAYDPRPLEGEEAESWKAYLEALFEAGFVFQGPTGFLTVLVFLMLPNGIDYSILNEAQRASLVAACGKCLYSHLWERMLLWDKRESIKYLLDLNPDFSNTLKNVVIEPGTSLETVDYAMSLGLKSLVVNAECDRDLLLGACDRGLKPYYWPSHEDPNRHMRRQAIDNRVYFGNSLTNGMLRICESGDLEVIEAFLKAGNIGIIDAESFRAKGMEDVADLLVSYDVREVNRVLRDIEPYVNPASMVASIPEGVEEISFDAFNGVDFAEIHFPTTLRVIHSNCLMRAKPMPRSLRELTIPKGVTFYGNLAGLCVEKLTIYDTINPDRPFDEPAVIESYIDFEVIVRSAETDDVLYRVWMPTSSRTKSEIRYAYRRAWGPNASFDFSKTDCYLNQLATKSQRLKTAVNRLRWPLRLTKGNEELCRELVVNNTLDAIKTCEGDDDAEGVEFILGLNPMGKDALNRLLNRLAKTGKVSRIEEYLEGYYEETFGPRRRRKSKRGRS